MNRRYCPQQSSLNVLENFNVSARASTVARNSVFIEQGELIGTIKVPWNSAVRSKVHAIHEPGVLRAEQLERFLASGGMLASLPHFVDAAWIASVARHEVFTTNAQPARNPKVDGIRLAQGSGWSPTGTIGIEKDLDRRHLRNPTLLDTAGMAAKPTSEYETKRTK
jgi:hypothetical protein